MRTTLSDLKRSILSRTFFAAILITVIAMWVGSISDLLSYYDLYKRIQVLTPELGDLLAMSALKSDAMLLCMPIIAAIPYTTAFIDDIKSGFIKHFLTRSRFSTYIISKVISCAVAGGLALALGVCIGNLTIKLAAAPITQAPVEAVSEYEDEELPPDEIDMPEAEPLFGIKSILPFFLSGMLWALVGMLMSAITMNKYMAYASPFILYYVLVILAERYFRTVYVLNPQNYLTLAGSWDLGAKSVHITLALFTLGVGLVFYIVAQRRLRA